MRLRDGAVVDPVDSLVGRDVDVGLLNNPPKKSYTRARTFVQEDYLLQVATTKSGRPKECAESKEAVVAWCWGRWNPGNLTMRCDGLETDADKAGTTGKGPLAD